MRSYLLVSLGLGAALACGDGGRTTVDAPVADAPVTDAAIIDAAPGPGVGQLTTRAADAVCAALFRCCDDDLVTYFAPFAADERLAAFAPRLPPRASLDEAGCRAVVREMFDVAPFADWVREAQAGRVDYLPSQTDACVAELSAAACGAPARAALYDSTCFAYAAPAGGDEQRRMFARTATAGAACGPIRDGIGATFYGTCDPTAAFCCYQAAGRDGLPVPLRLRRRAAPRDVPGGGGGRSGLLGRVAATALRHRQRLRRRDRSLPAAGHRAAGQRPGLRR
jgi:hypothetical protein